MKIGFAIFIIVALGCLFLAPQPGKSESSEPLKKLFEQTIADRPDYAVMADGKREIHSDIVRAFHDDTRNATCYVLYERTNNANGAIENPVGISCVPPPL